MSLWTFGYVRRQPGRSSSSCATCADPGSGGSAAYFQAFTFFVLPHGLLAMSIATTFVPEMARAVGRRDRKAFMRPRRSACASSPCSPCRQRSSCSCSAGRSIGLLLQHGEYTAADALVTSRALAGFALGLPAFSVYLFALRGFYAHQDTRTPFVINAGQCILNVVFALLLSAGGVCSGWVRRSPSSYVLGALWALHRAGEQGARLSVAPRPRVSVAMLARRGARRRGGLVGRPARRRQHRRRCVRADRRRHDRRRRRLRRSCSSCSPLPSSTAVRRLGRGRVRRRGVDLLGSAACSTSSRSGGST